MLAIKVRDVLGTESKHTFQKEEIVVGKMPSNDLVLDKPNISRRHAKLSKINNHYSITDLNSTNGVSVNGERITSATINEGDIIQIGNFTLTIQQMEEESNSLKTPPSPPIVENSSPPQYFDKEPIGSTFPQEILSSKDDVVAIKLRAKIHKILLEKLELRKLDIGKISEEELHRTTRQKINLIINQLEHEIPQEIDREELIKDVMNEVHGLGPLEDLLADENITEVMVNNKNQIYVEKNGKLSLSGKKFSSNEAVMAAIERIVAPIGRRIDEGSPLVDARLKDGSRVNAIIPPLALKGPCITIRKFFKNPLTIQRLISLGAITADIAHFLKLCVEQRKNIIISGGTGSGKTTFLNILSSFIPENERIVTIEDAAELQLPQEHVVSLESRPPNLEGRGAITIRDLVRNALRMRPDRIVVGECRGGETLDMLQAMNTGHDGSLTTLHANSPRDVISRLETMVLMSGLELPIPAIRGQIASAVDIIVQQTRFSCGTRKITYVSEVVGMEGNIITLQNIFEFRQEGYDAEGKVKGELVPTGFIPNFYEDMKKRGISVNLNIFKQ